MAMRWLLNAKLLAGY